MYVNEAIDPSVVLLTHKAMRSCPTNKVDIHGARRGEH
ncbi:hypothetical protein ABIE86_000098 [Bradyrhizobium diazoefficiens]